MTAYFISADEVGIYDAGY